jgi:hypothetical protein
MSRALLTAVLTLAALAAHADERIVDIRQGTNMYVAVAPGG